MSKVKCPRCLGEYAVKLNGEIRKHPCFEATDMDRAADAGATPLELMRQAASEAGFDVPAAEPQQCSEPRCTCGGHGGPEHELAVIAYGDDPVDELGPVGPWHGALDTGRCGTCENVVHEGDRVRLIDGMYECEDCGRDGGPENEPNPDQLMVEGWQEQASAAAKRHVEANATDTPYVALLKDAIVTEVQDEVVIQLPAPETFLDPFDLPAQEAPKLNVSGQPEPNRDWQGRYIVKDPDLGDFRRYKNGNPEGLTRVTTFIKAAANNKAINDWSKRNVVMGASLRPDILRRAHGLTHDNGKDQLDRIVGELDTAAGGKVSADEGTYLHEETEYIDAGLKTWQESPPAYQQDLKRYTEALAAYGLEPVPGLIERTVMVREFGGVVGSFDRIFYHRASGQYVIGDLKTGKTLKWGYDEIQAQLWFYAHGVNQNGLYDWNTDTWVRDDPSRGGLLATVREDVAVIIHMPVQGPEAGAVYVRKADLVRGRAYAELCGSVRDWDKSKVQDWTGVPGVIDFSVIDPIPWGLLFSQVRTNEEATALWRRAKVAGKAGVELNELIQIARDALVGKG